MNSIPLPDYWEGFEYGLSYLERLSALLEKCGDLCPEDQRMLGGLARDLLRIVCTGLPANRTPPAPQAVLLPDPPSPVGAVPTESPGPGVSGTVRDGQGSPAEGTAPPPQAHKPRSRPTRRPRVPTASQNGHLEPERVRWSMNDRLKHLGYPQDIDRSKRVRLGQAAVDAYKQEYHGKGPRMAENHTDQHARRIALYREWDLPMVDRLIKEIIGEPTGSWTVHQTWGNRTIRANTHDFQGQ